MQETKNGTYRDKTIRRIILGAIAAFFVLAGCTYGYRLLHNSFCTLGDFTPRPPETEATAEYSNPPTELPTGAEESAPPTELPTGAEESAPPTELPTEATQPPEVSPEQAMLDAMSLDEKICQLFMVAPEALSGGEIVTAAPEDLAQELEKYPVGGIILFAHNLIDREQCEALIQGFQHAGKTPLFIGVDEEGGAVSRLSANKAIGVTHFAAMGNISASGISAYTVGQTLGSELKELGFNLDFAPVADVNSNPDNPIIGSRAFSSDPEEAAKMVADCVLGFRDAGLISCLKHFPGHGDTTQDSHAELASLPKSMDDLYSMELIPFRKGMEAGAPMVMVGHINLPEITGDRLPATLSPKIVTELLRKDMGYEGVVVTDAMNMGAITEAYPSGQAAVFALQAGCDLILMPEDLSSAVAAVKSAVTEGTLTVDRINESVMRILELKLAYGICRSN